MADRTTLHGLLMTGALMGAYIATRGIWYLNGWLRK
jgi:hypothetical protein